MGPVPQLLPVFPLSAVLFPDALLQLHVFESRYRVMTSHCLEGDGRFGVVLISRGSEVGGGEARVAVGTVARIEQASPLEDGRWILVARGAERFRVREWLADDPYPRGMVEALPESGPEADVSDLVVAATAAVQRTRALLSEIQHVPQPQSEIPREPVASSWWLCQHAPLSAFDRQRLLECEDLVERLRLIREMVGSLAEDLSRLLSRGV